MTSCRKCRRDAPRILVTTHPRPDSLEPIGAEPFSSVFHAWMRRGRDRHGRLRRHLGATPGGGGGGADAVDAAAAVARRSSRRNVAARRAGRHRCHRQRRSVRHHLRPLAGDRPVAGSRLPRRRPREKGQLLFTLDRAAFRSGARPGRSEPRHGTRRCWRRPKRSWLATRRTPSISSSPRERQSQLVRARHPLQGRRAAGAVAGRRHRGARQGRHGDVESTKAQLAAQQAAVDNARVQLNYYVDQVADRRAHGQFQREGRQPRHRQSDRDDDDRAASAGLRHLRRPGDPPVRRSSARDGQQHKLSVTATPQDAEAQPATACSPSSTTPSTSTTDTIKLKATFDNSDQPSVARSVRARLAAAHDAAERHRRAVQAVQTGQDGQYVFVVKPDSTVEQRPVVTGQNVARTWSCRRGSPWRAVVTEGQLPARAGLARPRRIVSGVARRTWRGGRGGRRATASRQGQSRSGALPAK